MQINDDTKHFYKLGFTTDGKKIEKIKCYSKKHIEIWCNVGSKKKKRIDNESTSPPVHSSSMYTTILSFTNEFIQIFQLMSKIMGIPCTIVSHRYSSIVDTDNCVTHTPSGCLTKTFRPIPDGSHVLSSNFLISTIVYVLIMWPVIANNIMNIS